MHQPDLEDIAKTMLTTQLSAITGINYFVGFEAIEVVDPCVIVTAPTETFEQVGQGYTGRSEIDLIVSVGSALGDWSRAEHETLAELVRNVMLNTDCPSRLETISQALSASVGIQDCSTGNSERSIEGTSRKTALSIKVTAFSK